MQRQPPAFPIPAGHVQWPKVEPVGNSSSCSASTTWRSFSQIFLPYPAAFPLDARHSQAGPTSLPQPPGLSLSSPKRPQAHRHRQWAPGSSGQHNPGQLLGSRVQDCCMQPSMLGEKTLKNTQIFHRAYSTLPGNMSAASGTELARGFSKLIILGCFLELISSNAKWSSTANMEKTFKNTYQSTVSNANKTKSNLSVLWN